MRTSLILGSILGGALAIVACGDASQNTSEDYRPANEGTQTGTPAASSTATDNDPTAGTADPSATVDNTPPPAPSSSGTAAAGAFAAAVDNATPAADLGLDMVVNVTITPSSGFTGPVELSLAGAAGVALPAGLTGVFDDANPSISGTTPIVAKLTISSALTAQPATIPLVVTAKGMSGTTPVTATANINYKINAQFTMFVPLNVTAMEAAGGGLTDAYGKTFGVTPATLTAPALNNGVAVPIIVKVQNLDSTSHIIHGNGAGNSVGTSTSTANFPHGSTTTALIQNAIDPTARQVVAVAGKTNVYNGYLHDIGSGKGTGFAIEVGAQQ